MIPTALLCLPYAGAGAAFFRKWEPLAPAGLTIVPIQLPGREERYLDRPHTDARAAMDEACPWAIDRIARLGGDAERVAVFGHSLGAALAYELTRRLCGHGIEVSRLYVSGASGPRDRDLERISELDDEGFVDGLRRISGYSHPALSDAGMRDAIITFLRADSVMHETYRSGYAEPISTPITALRGHDDGFVSAPEAAAWAAETDAEFRYLEFEGSHMYLVDHAEALLQTIVADLEGNGP